MRLQAFLERFPDAKIIYLARDPVASIPSTMSLITDVLDRTFDFWGLPEDHKQRYLERLYKGLLSLIQGFHADWTSGKVDRSRVQVVQYDRMMSDFGGVMMAICEFTGHTPTAQQMARIREVAQS